MSKLSYDKYRLNRGNNIEFSDVYHISHIDNALIIIEDGRIISSLIWDESSLNNTRTLVSWVSPNKWANGSIYGHISFVMDWNKICDSCNFYWVEAITKYSPTAVRIIISNNELMESNIKKYIIPFDPSIKDSPIIFENNKWYRHNNYTTEFMIDSDIPLNNLKRIDIEKHNSICKNFGRNCIDIDYSLYEAGEIFIALILSKEINSINFLLIDNSEEDFVLHHNLKMSLAFLIRDFLHGFNNNGEIVDVDKALLILKSALFFYGHRKFEESFILANMIRSKSLFLDCFEKLLRIHFTQKNINNLIEFIKGQLSVYLGKNWQNG